MISLLLPACLVTAILDWLAVAKGWRWLEYIAKPAVMLFLLAWMTSSLHLAGAPSWFAIGIICSLVGDVMLVLPQVRFLPGLLAFLMAHLAYITGFNQTLPSLSLPGILLALIVAVVAWRIYLRLAGGIRQKAPRLAAPVLIYTVVISVMLISALLTFFRADWLRLAALLSSLGALFFFLSDSLLAWNRFVSPTRFGRLPEIIAYHLGQIMIISGVILQFR
jgi:uncharacterized membrane protein YhhN